ncbi:sporulation protein YjcZ [Paenibacillus sp. PR3]|uniref:Sporulation protein YjcZ n=1 Tax=Paenibacillus terricola TaxID=2763503 RepID=A0ABR8MSN7_9BACL|nr:sporulation protein YjcZ [Paenibacillus terricola]MBD3918655.1 sporulation protein YjcZ [Paenibacillus terricola]
MGYPVAGAGVGPGYGGSCLGGFGVGGICTSIGVILVLYILLVIVLRAGWF